jgi:flavin reductase (DIM6/NTAB) family NADH-FMN oxidoreductase RutF
MRDATGVAAAEFRRAMGTFATGVTVVTCRLGPLTHGITVNSLTAVSLDPPLILICVDRAARAHDLIPEAEYFAVNVLGENQRELCTYFARRLAPDPNDELRDLPYRVGETGAPLLGGCHAHLECRVVAAHPAGDHTIYVAEVLATDVVSDGPPLLFYRGKFPQLSLEPQPTT